MLLGGLWHGASWNFMIWGGLNGLGMLIYRFWKSCNVYVRTLVKVPFRLAFYILNTTVTRTCVQPVLRLDAHHIHRRRRVDALTICAASRPPSRGLRLAGR